MPPHIECDRLLLRRFKLSDASAIFNGFASDPGATKYVSWPTHKTIEDTYAYLKHASESWEKGAGYYYGIIEKTSGDLVGSAGFVNESGKVFIGYILAATAWGKGYATEAAKALVTLLDQDQTYYRIWACCDAEHDASAKVLRKIGMRREALIKNWCLFPNQGNKPKDCLFFVLPEGQ